MSVSIFFSPFNYFVNVSRNNTDNAGVLNNFSTIKNLLLCLIISLKNKSITSDVLTVNTDP